MKGGEKKMWKRNPNGNCLTQLTINMNNSNEIMVRVKQNSFACSYSLLFLFLFHFIFRYFFLFSYRFKHLKYNMRGEWSEKHGKLFYCVPFTPLATQCVHIASQCITTQFTTNIKRQCKSAVCYSKQRENENEIESKMQIEEGRFAPANHFVVLTNFHSHYGCE